MAGAPHKLWTYARVCPVFSANDATCQLEVRSNGEGTAAGRPREHVLSLEIPYSDSRERIPYSENRRSEYGGSGRTRTAETCLEPIVWVGLAEL